MTPTSSASLTLQDRWATAMDVNSLRLPRMLLVGEGQHAARPRPRTPSRPGPSPPCLRQSSRATGGRGDASHYRETGWRWR